MGFESAAITAQCQMKWTLSGVRFASDTPVRLTISDAYTLRLNVEFCGLPLVFTRSTSAMCTTSVWCTGVITLPAAAFAASIGKTLEFAS